MRLEEKVPGFRCVACGKEHALDGAEYLCPACGGNLDVVYDYRRIAKASGTGTRGFPKRAEPDIWRYELLLPVGDEPPGVPGGGRRLPGARGCVPGGAPEGRGGRPPLLVGMSPLYRADRLAAKLGVREIFVKDDGRNPSASAKDRASAVVIARARERGIGRIACASTGNAASSLACLCAPLRMETVLFVPASAPRAKIAQLMVYGAFVVTVDGDYDDAYELSLAASGEYGWHNRNTGYNPFTREGKKTISYEVCEQLGWQCPDLVFVPVGDGNLMSGVWKGFRDLHEIGRIARLPRLVACQAAGSDAVKRGFETGGKIEPASGETVADSISVRLPRDGLAAVRAIEQSGGFAVSCGDGEILEAVRVLARETGVFAEPAGAAPLAALVKAAASGLVGPRDRVVLLATGNGLKDVDPVAASMAAPVRIKPDPGELRRAISRMGL